MARPKFRSPEQSLPVQALCALVEFAASLKLAVVLIFGSAFVLAAATFVEKHYGTRGVQFGIYGTWWFTLLNALLAVNIFSAAVTRFPWKRHQTGFVITHTGLLTLLFGCLLSRQWGIDAQMPIMEGRMNSKAYEDSQHFRLVIRKDAEQGINRASPVGSETDSQPAAAKQEEVIAIPFEGGPFNWQDYKTLPPIIQFMRLAHRDRGVLYDRDGIRLEVLDYYGDSRELPAPYVKLRISTPQAAQDRTSADTPWMPAEFFIRSSTDALRGSRPVGIGHRERLGGGSVTFWMVTGKAEQQAFLKSKPEGSLGERGQVILHAGGKRHLVRLDETVGGPKFPLGDSGLAAEVSGYYRTATLAENTHPSEMKLAEGGAANAPAEQPAVEIKLYKDDEPVGRLVLFADMPELDLPDYQNQVFGSFWFDHGAALRQDQFATGQGGSRIDIIQGADQKLYYRYWNRREVAALAELPADGTKVDAFKMPIAQLQMYVEHFIPAAKPGTKIEPIAYDPEQIAVGATRAARLKLTVDGTSEEFWLKGPPARLLEIERPDPSETRLVRGKDRTVAITLPLDEIDVGFRVKLENFERKLDPGTSQASDFTSYVRLMDHKEDRELLKTEKPVVITMNAPIDFSDPQSGRSYRLFQEAFRGPYKPGDAVYESHFAGVSSNERPDQLLLSILTVNYDVGRLPKQIGCLLIVGGIFTMFYMRAYFFRPKSATAEPHRERELVEAQAVGAR